MNYELFFLGVAIGLLGGLVFCDLLNRYMNFKRWYKHKIIFHNGETRTILSCDRNTLTVDIPL